MKLEARRTSMKPGAVIASLSVLFILVAAAGALLVLSIAGPPEVESREAYGDSQGTASFDHGLFDAVLGRWVSADGWVDYEGLSTDSDRLAAYISSVATAPFDALGRDEKLALLINAYNAFTLQLILDYRAEGDLSSIRGIPGSARWDDRRWTVGGKLLSLNELEHREIRLDFQEPRVHFALVCAAWSCPPLRNEAYEGAILDEQLEDQARYVHEHDRWFRYDSDKKTVELTRLYDWYGGDFEQVEESVLEFAAHYSQELRRDLAAGSDPSVHWLPYDWRLNSFENAPRGD